MKSTILKKKDLRKEKEDIYEQLSKEESKLESLKGQLIEVKKKNYRELFKDFFEFILLFWLKLKFL